MRTLLYIQSLLIGWFCGYQVTLHDGLLYSSTDRNGCDPLALLVWVGVSAGLCWASSRWADKWNK